MFKIDLSQHICILRKEDASPRKGQLNFNRTFSKILKQEHFFVTELGAEILKVACFFFHLCFVAEKCHT